MVKTLSQCSILTEREDFQNKIALKCFLNSNKYFIMIFQQYFIVKMFINSYIVRTFSDQWFIVRTLSEPCYFVETLVKSNYY